MKGSHQSADPYVSQSYWEQRLKNMHDLRGTGHRQFSVAYNEAMYLMAVERLKSALADAGIDLAKKRILDIGPGFGYFVKEYIEAGAAHVTGVDITQICTEELRRAFPQHEFIQADISERNLPIAADFDLVCAISVIFHIVEDDKFRSALENMCARVKPGGHLIIVDTFRDPMLFSMKHVHVRSHKYYEPIFREFGFQIRVIRPMYYLFGQSYIPGLVSKFLSLPSMIATLIRLERWLSTASPRDWYFLKYLIAQRS